MDPIRHLYVEISAILRPLWCSMSVFVGLRWENQNLKQAIPLLRDFTEGTKKAENPAGTPTSNGICNGDAESGIFHVPLVDYDA